MDSTDQEGRETPTRVTATFLITERFVYRFATIGFIVGVIALAVALVLPLVFGIGHHE